MFFIPKCSPLSCRVSFATLGFELKEQSLTLVDIEQADEVFFTNAVRGVQPVKRYLDVCYSTEQSNRIHQAWSNWQIDNAVAVTNLKSIT